MNEDFVQTLYMYAKVAAVLGALAGGVLGLNRQATGLDAQSTIRQDVIEARCGRKCVGEKIREELCRAGIAHGEYCASR